MHAWAEVCHLLQSSKSPLTGFLYIIGWRITGFLQTLPHTNSISNSAILRNNYISLLSDLYTCVHVKKKWRRKGSHSSSVSGSNRLVRLQTWKKAMGWYTAQWKMLLFCAKNHCERVTQIWTSPSEEEEEEDGERKTFWPSGDFLVRYFCDAF